MQQVVIIVGVGRSGTTLLQRVINTMPSTNICGENRNAWIHLARFANSWLQLKISNRGEYAKREQALDHYALAWYNVVGGDALCAALRTMFLTMYAGDLWRRIGFKEIRIGQQGYDQMQAQLEFFRMLFPQCKIIFNLRDPKAILKSQSQEIGQFGDPAAQSLFHRYSQEHGALLWHYEDWDKPRKIKLIYDYLGEPFTQDYLVALQAHTRRV